MFLVCIFSFMFIVVMGCNEPLDLVFLVDGSSGVSPSDFIQEKAFVSSQTMEYYVSSKRVKIAVMLYSDIVWDNIDFKMSENDELFISKVFSMSQPFGDLFTNNALKAVKNLFKTEGRPGAKRATVLLTTGRSSRLWESFRDARHLRKDHVALYAIGVGSGVSKNELMGLTSDRNNVLLLDTFNSLFSMSSKIHELICPGYKDSSGSVLSRASMSLLKPQIELSIISNIDNKGLSPLLPQRTNLIDNVDAEILDVQNNKRNPSNDNVENSNEYHSDDSVNITKILSDPNLTGHGRVNPTQFYVSGHVFYNGEKKNHTNYQRAENAVNFSKIRTLEKVNSKEVSKEENNLYQKKIPGFHNVANVTKTQDLTETYVLEQSTKLTNETSPKRNIIAKGSWNMIISGVKQNYNSRRKSNLDDLQHSMPTEEHSKMAQNIPDFKVDQFGICMATADLNFKERMGGITLTGTSQMTGIPSKMKNTKLTQDQIPFLKVRKHSIWDTLLENIELNTVKKSAGVKVPVDINKKIQLINKEDTSFGSHRNHIDAVTKLPDIKVQHMPFISQLDQMVHGQITDKGETNHLSLQRVNAYLDTTVFKKRENARTKLKTKSIPSRILDKSVFGKNSEKLGTKNATESFANDKPPTINIGKFNRDWNYFSVFIPTTTTAHTPRVATVATTTTVATPKSPTVAITTTVHSLKSTTVATTTTVVTPPTTYVATTTTIATPQTATVGTPLTASTPHTSTSATTKSTITTRSTTARPKLAPIKAMNTFRHKQKIILENKQKKPRMSRIFNSRKGRPINMNLKRKSDRNKLSYFEHSKDLRKDIAFLLDLIMLEHDRTAKRKKRKRKPKTTTTLKPEATTSTPPVVWKDASNINDNRKRRIDNPVYNSRYTDMTRYGKKNIPDDWNYRRQAKFRPGNEIRRKFLSKSTSGSENDNPIVSENEHCSLFPYEKDSSFYLENTENRTVIRPCPEGTAFDLRSCACTIMTSVRSFSDCHPEIVLDFDSDVRDKSGKNIHVGSHFVRLSNGSAVFNGDSDLTIWRFTGSHIGQQLLIKARFKAIKSPEVRQSVISNCHYDIGISFGIEIDRFKEVVIFSLDTQPRDRMEIKIPFKLDQWTDVSLIYTGHMFTGIVDSQKKYVPLAGDVETRSSPLRIGGCGGRSHGFSGLIDEISVSFCIPKKKRRRFFG